jgi:DNA polymerase I-like protein with 3'-5' exonuclease and polymerase domains
MILCLDFETKDPYISDDKKMGHGWVYSMCHPATSEFKVLGASFKVLNSLEEPKYITDIDDIVSITKDADGFVMHNAQYDFGCLMYLHSLKNPDISYLYDKDILDTFVMSFLNNSVRQSHRLDDLGKELLGEKKDTQVLIDAAHKYNLKPYTLAEIRKKKRAQKNNEEYFRERPSDAILYRLAIKNLDKLPHSVVAKYCNQDIVVTEKLYKYFVSRIGDYPYKESSNTLMEELEIVLMYSNLAKVCCKNRLNGAPINKKVLAKNTIEMEMLKQKKAEDFCGMIGAQVNIHSPKQVTSALLSVGVDCPKTEKGNYSAKSKWLEKQDHPACKCLKEVRKAHKIWNDFLVGVQRRIDTIGASLIYPELRILGARTSRFSCTGPNIQQIPSDKVYGKLCREIYSVEGSDFPEDVLFHSLDYANQEGRLQLHYAYLLGCTGAEQAVKVAQCPNWDMHLEIARLIWGSGVNKDSNERKLAKAINFGLSYGMGLAKLSKELNCGMSEAKKLLNEYFKAAPYLKQLKAKCRNALERKGYLNILGGTRSHLEKPKDGKTFEYKALNKLIQGSAAYQTTAAMIEADREGVDILFPVHDEIVLIGTVEDANRMKNIMETCVKLVVPTIVSHSYGKSWGDCK